MSYDDKAFWERYREYLKEPMVRKNHNAMFRLFARLMTPDPPRVMDFGCGSGEYARHDICYIEYAGIDKTDVGGVRNFIQADYTELGFADALPFTPNAFISLFSSELSSPCAVKYDLYTRIFMNFPCIQFGMVSGFFYESKRGHETVEETGGLISHQTIEDPTLWISPLFTESRTHIYTPSEMFGKDVIEVWKVFIRKGVL